MTRARMKPEAKKLNVNTTANVQGVGTAKKLFSKRKWTKTKNPTVCVSTTE